MVLMLNDYYVYFGVSIDDASFQLLDAERRGDWKNYDRLLSDLILYE